MSPVQINRIAHALGWATVGAAAVQVNEDVARFLAVARADNPAILQFIHDASGAAIAKAQAALEEGDAGLLFAADDLDAVLDDLFVLVDAALVIEATAGAGDLLVDFEFVAGLGLLGDETHHALNLAVGHERALCADQLGRAGRQIEQVAFADQLFGAHPTNN